MSDGSNGAGIEGWGFGPFRLLPTQRLLLEDGEPVELGARALLPAYFN